ncbi:MAG: DUF4145 domain-containing protein [Syntrophomonadaceae bacterium]|nr:DUF4145 domain-containing protein [Syntrophomonadaceae bacterium]
MGNWTWSGATRISSRAYTCGYCGLEVASSFGYEAVAKTMVGAATQKAAFIRICPHCSRPTFFEGNMRVPAAMFGRHVSKVSDPGVAAMYDEARRCIGCGAYTAAVMCCRKLLLHVAVAQGASPDMPFHECIDFLAQRHFIPANVREWADRLRAAESEASHEIAIMSEDDARVLVSLVEMLLTIVYEFPARIETLKPPARE